MIYHQSHPLRRLRILLACAPDAPAAYLIQRGLKLEAIKLLDEAGVNARTAEELSDVRCKTCDDTGECVSIGLTDEYVECRDCSPSELWQEIHRLRALVPVEKQ